MGYDSKGILVFNLKYEHAISFINLVKFINHYQMPRSISSKLFVIRDFTVIGAILDRGQKSERKQYGSDLMKAQFEECKM